MGCDIHSCLEARIDGAWRMMTPLHPMRGNPDALDVLLDEQPIRDRNYALFAMLADVRNGDLVERIEPIHPPRGIPDDASDLARTWLSWSADHTTSWASLAELQAYSGHRWIVWHGRTFRFRELAGELTDRAMPLMEDMACVYQITRDDVRMLYGFDN